MLKPDAEARCWSRLLNAMLAICNWKAHNAMQAIYIYIYIYAHNAMLAIYIHLLAQCYAGHLYIYIYIYIYIYVHNAMLATCSLEVHRCSMLCWPYVVERRTDILWGAQTLPNALLLSLKRSGRKRRHATLLNIHILGSQSKIFLAQSKHRDVQTHCTSTRFYWTLHTHTHTCTHTHMHTHTHTQMHAHTLTLTDSPPGWQGVHFWGTTTQTSRPALEPFVSQACGLGHAAEAGAIKRKDAPAPWIVNL
jgi:hypothetical protein